MNITFDTSRLVRASEVMRGQAGPSKAALLHFSELNLNITNALFFVFLHLLPPDTGVNYTGLWLLGDGLDSFGSKPLQSVGASPQLESSF